MHELVQACKKISSFNYFIVEIQSISESRDQISHTYFLKCPTKKFSSIFYFCEFLSTSYFINFIWWYDLYFFRNTTNNENFYYGTNSVKINDQFFSLNSKNPIFGIFWTHFPKCLGKKVFSKKLGCHALLPSF